MAEDLNPYVLVLQVFLHFLLHFARELVNEEVAEYMTSRVANDDIVEDHTGEVEEVLDRAHNVDGPSTK